MGDRSVVFRGHPKVWSLLAYLALRDGALLDRETVAAALWPDVDDAAARGNLRRHVSYLSEALQGGSGDCWLARSATHIGLTAERPIWIDSRLFADASLDDTRLVEAKNLYRGELLAGLHDEWAAAERDRFRERYVYILERLVTIERRNGNLTTALQYASEALRADPFREDLVRSLMRLRFEAGDRAGALREFERFSEVIRTELQVEPAEETVSLATALRTNERATPEVHTLPLEETSFVGRAHDLAALDRILGEARLVTISGAPGVGKTRLALRYAHIAENRFIDGARFIDLSAASGPESISRAVEGAFEARTRTREESSSPIEQRLRKKKMLLILDNCEGAIEACANFVSRLLRVAPDVRVIATSRIVLKADGEAAFSLSPLEESDAGRLFIDRARFARRGITADLLAAADLSAIMRATDGLPLALELCAARVRTLTLAEVITRLRRPLALIGDEIGTYDSQNRTLRASLESSYALLEASQQRLFRRFSVFAGNPTIDAVRSIVLDDLSEAAALELLSSLADHSLLVAPGIDAPEQRFGMLQSIRDFAQEKLEREEDADTIRAAHARYFGLRYAAQNDALRGPRAHQFFDVVARDHDDLRAALDRLVHRRENMELGSRLALALSRFWFDRGYVHEGAPLLEALAASGGISSTLRAQVLHCLATLIRNQGDFERAFLLFGNALAELRESGDAVSIGKGLATYSNAARMTGRYDLALELAAEALRLFETTDDRYLCAYALLTSGCAAFSRGTFAAARDFFARSLEGYRSVDAAADIALALGNLGVVAFYENDLDTATLLSTESVERARELGNAYYEASALSTLARVAFARGQTTTAHATLHTTLRLARAIGDKELLIGCIEFAARLLVEEDPVCGTTFLGCVDAAREFYHIPRSPIEREECTSLEVALANRLRGDMYAAAKQAGRALALDEVLDRATGERVVQPRPRVALAN